MRKIQVTGSNNRYQLRDYSKSTYIAEKRLVNGSKFGHVNPVYSYTNRIVQFVYAFKNNSYLCTHEAKDIRSKQLAQRVLP